MNTNTVAKLLKVSPSTIHRWVKQLDLDMERNELGHYIFTKEDIDLLKNVQEQINKGSILQEITISRNKVRKGAVKANIADKFTEDILDKLEILEQRIAQKADEVVSYQLLQHRREIEDLQNEVVNLNKRIEVIELNKQETHKNIPSENLLIYDQERQKKKLKKKRLISSFFGF